MSTYRVKGMRCASCATIIGKKISSMEGVRKAHVNFAADQAEVEFEHGILSVDEINKEIKPLGYEFVENMERLQYAEEQRGNHAYGDHTGLNQTKEEKFQELSREKRRVRFALPLALVTFAIMMWEISMRFSGNVPEIPISMGVMNSLFLVLGTIMMFWIGRPFIRGVVTFIQYRVANMDTLIGIGTLTAYLYSAFVVLFPGIREIIGLPEYVYFDVTIVVIGFVVFGKYLEARSRFKTGEAIERLLELQAKTAIVIRDEKEVELDIRDVVVGDVIVVKPGMKIPVDGVIREGSTSIDESMVTGESVPVDKKNGDEVIGSTINKQGSFMFIASKVGSDTLLSQIVDMVARAQGSRAPIQALADKISGVFVPIVLVIALLSLGFWLTLGSYYLGFDIALSYGLLSFVGVLVIACPCALGLATPTALIVGVGKGAENGVLVKDAESLERLQWIDTIVFDKTGTITKGKPEMTDVCVMDGTYTEEDIMLLAASVEKYSEHPLADAIVASVHGELKKVEDFIAKEGVGVEGKIDGVLVAVQKPSKNSSGAISELQGQGKTVVEVLVDQKLIGIIALADTIKEGVPELVRELHILKITTVMLTGDNKRAAEHIAKEAGIDTVISEVMPSEKADKVAALKSKGKKVAMVGDGVNDAPALAGADVGIAMATGTDVAIESAGVTLLGGDIRKVSSAIRLSKMTMRTVRQNLFWAFIYNMIGVPIAAGFLYPIWGILLNPIFAGIAMAGSSVSVVVNSLRLKGVKIK